MKEEYPAYADVTITKKEGSMIEIKGEVPTETLHRYRMKAFRALSGNLDIPGFRKGHVPEDMALAHIGEATLMHEAAERALSHTYPEIVRAFSLDVVGRPEISITKLAAGNPLGFTITTTVYPEITLPAYLAIAEEEREKHEDPEKIIVSVDAVREEVKRLQKVMASQGVSGDKVPEGADEVALPEPDDAFAKTLGDFSGLADLEEKIERGMLLDRKEKARDARRLAVIDAVLAKTEVQVPELFVESELDQIVGTFIQRVERSGVTIHEYLESIGKTEDELRTEWRPQAEKKAKMQVALNAIAKKEGIVPDSARVERQVAHLKEHYPDADPESLRMFVTTQMTNDLVFVFLEGSTPPVA